MLTCKSPLIAKTLEVNGMSYWQIRGAKYLEEVPDEGFIAVVPLPDRADWGQFLPKRLDLNRRYSVTYRKKLIKLLYKVLKEKQFSRLIIRIRPQHKKSIAAVKRLGAKEWRNDLYVLEVKDG